MISAFYGSLYPNPNPAVPSFKPTLDDALVSQIQDSGFTTVILGLFHVAGNPQPAPPPATHLLGDIIFNQGPSVVSGGVIQTSAVGTDPSSDWAHYLNALKSTGSVDKIYLSFGGGSPVEDFTLIISSFLQYLDPTTSCGPYIPCNSSLYLNFQALRTYLPMVDGIDIDQEEGTDSSYIDAMTAFGIMARSVGFGEITYAPPFDSTLAAYQAAAQAINAFALQSASLTIGGTVYPYSDFAYPAGSAPTPASLPGFSTRLGLQYYSGGFESTDVASWLTAATAIGSAGGGNAPQLLIGASGWYSNPPGNMVAFFQQYPDPAWAGGFIWDFNAITGNLSGYQNAIQTGLKPPC